MAAESQIRKKRKPLQAIHIYLTGTNKAPPDHISPGQQQATPDKVTDIPLYKAA